MDTDRGFADRRLIRANHDHDLVVIGPHKLPPIDESMWGNTRTVAEAVAEGVGSDVEVVHAVDAPAPLPDGVGLLVIGGPTHAFSLPRVSTRRDAIAKGARRPTRPSAGSASGWPG